jgi:hypothetical protein
MSGQVCGAWWMAGPLIFTSAQCRLRWSVAGLDQGQEPRRASRDGPEPPSTVTRASPRASCGLGKMRRGRAQGACRGAEDRCYLERPASRRPGAVVLSDDRRYRCERQEHLRPQRPRRSAGQDRRPYGTAPPTFILMVKSGGRWGRRPLSKSVGSIHFILSSSVASLHRFLPLISSI